MKTSFIFPDSYVVLSLCPVEGVIFSEQLVGVTREQVLDEIWQHRHAFRVMHICADSAPRDVSEEIVCAWIDDQDPEEITEKMRDHLDRIWSGASDYIDERKAIPSAVPHYRTYPQIGGAR